MKVLPTNFSIDQGARASRPLILGSAAGETHRAPFQHLTCLLLSAALLLPVLAQQAPATAPTAEQMQAFLTNRPEQDMIHWKDPARGDSLTVRILDISNTEVRVQKTLQRGLTTQVVPRSQLSGVSFARTPVEQRLIHHPTAADAVGLRVLWGTRKASLGMEDTNVADFGIALAKSLRMSREEKNFVEAEDLLQEILTKNPTDHHKAAAEIELRTLELTRALASSPPEEIDRIAWEITEIEASPEAMLMATAWLGDRHFEDLKRLEEEHPRWDMDDEVRPIRWRLYHLSLDFVLYPSLFHGTHAEEASIGLKKAWNVHQHTRSPELALQTLEDLAALYPDSQAAKDTADELARMQARQSQGSLLEEAAAEQPIEDAEETGDDEKPRSLPTPPPTPQRYNLFTD